MPDVPLSVFRGGDRRVYQIARVLHAIPGTLHRRVHSSERPDGTIVAVCRRSAVMGHFQGEKNMRVVVGVDSWRKMWICRT